MISVNLQDIRTSVEDDLAGLGLYLQQLIGEPLLFFRQSYADELTIHFGTPIERTSPKLKKRPRGSYVLATRGSLWTMIATAQGRLVLSDLPRQMSDAGLSRLVSIDLEQSPPVSAGAKLAWALPYADDLSGGIALALGFSDQARLIIRPEPPSGDAEVSSDEPEREVADWELLTPIGRYLTVGPGRKWAYLATTPGAR
jgi:hypothetical protein